MDVRDDATDAEIAEWLSYHLNWTSRMNGSNLLNDQPIEATSEPYFYPDRPQRTATEPRP